MATKQNSKRSKYLTKQQYFTAYKEAGYSDEEAYKWATYYSEKDAQIRSQKQARSDKMKQRVGKVLKTTGTACMLIGGIPLAVMNPFATIGAIAGGYGVDQGIKATTKYKGWGDMVADNTFLSEETAEIFNPGMIAGGFVGGFGERAAASMLGHSNLGRAWTIGSMLNDASPQFNRNIQISPFIRVAPRGGTRNLAYNFVHPDAPNSSFELVRDVDLGTHEPNGQYSIHFKTEGKNSLTSQQKDELFQAVADFLPEGTEISSHGNLSKGGKHGVDRFGTQFGWPEVGTRQVNWKAGQNIDGVVTQEGDPLNLGIYRKPITEAPESKKGWNDYVDFEFDENGNFGPKKKSYKINEDESMTRTGRENDGFYYIGDGWNNETSGQAIYDPKTGEFQITPQAYDSRMAEIQEAIPSWIDDNIAMLKKDQYRQIVYDGFIEDGYTPEQAQQLADKYIAARIQSTQKGTTSFVKVPKDQNGTFYGEMEVNPFEGVHDTRLNIDENSNTSLDAVRETFNHERGGHGSTYNLENEPFGNQINRMAQSQSKYENPIIDLGVQHNAHYLPTYEDLNPFYQAVLDGDAERATQIAIESGLQKQMGTDGKINLQKALDQLNYITGNMKGMQEIGARVHAERVGPSTWNTQQLTEMFRPEYLARIRKGLFQFGIPTAISMGAYATQKNRFGGVLKNRNKL